MHRTGNCLATSIIALFLVAFSTLYPAPARSQTAPPQDWTQAKTTVAKIDVLGPGGAALRQSYGAVVGAPACLVVRLSDLLGAEKVVASFPDKSTVTSSRVLATDPANDIAVLETDGILPLGEAGDQTIRWMYQEKITVIPGPDMPDETPEILSREPLLFGTVRIVPIDGEHPAGLPVMHYCGRWIGLTGAIHDPSGQFFFMTPQEVILPLLLGKGGAKPIAGIAQTSADWLDPSTARGLFVRGVLTSYRAPIQAEPYFNLALERDKSLPELHFWMGKNYFRQPQKYAEAEASFREAARLSPNWPLTFFMAGAAAFQQKKYIEAVQIYNEGLRTNPKSAMIMSNKAAALGNMGRQDEAVESLKQAIAADPSYGMALFNLGALYMQMGKRLEAEEQYPKLLEVDKTLAQQLRTLLDTK